MPASSTRTVEPAEYRIQLPKPHPAQQQILGGAKRFNVACLGRRSGKTRIGMNLAADTALQGFPVAWFAPIGKYMEEQWAALRFTLAAVTSRKNESLRRLELITGGTIDFWTMEDQDAGRGRRYKRVILDEAAMARNLERAWTFAIRPTLTDLKGDAWFFSTPKGTGNYFARLFGRAGSELGWARWQMPSHCNPYLDPEELEAARREMPELAYRQEYLAEFVDMAGAAIRREWLSYAEPPLAGSLGMGVDLAISTKQDADYSAAAVLARDDQFIYILDVVRWRAPFNQSLANIARIAERWRAVRIYIEETQFQAAVVQELLRTTRLPVYGVRPDRDKLTRFLPMAARYERGLVKHHPRLKDGEFESELLSFPVGENDDMVDAVGYAYDAVMAGAARPAVSWR